MVTVQMLLSLVVVALVAKVILGAVSVGQKKRSADHQQAPLAVDPPDPVTD